MQPSEPQRHALNWLKADHQDPILWQLSGANTDQRLFPSKTFNYCIIILSKYERATR